MISIHVDIQADERGQFTDSEYRVLNALSSIRVDSATIGVAGLTDSDVDTLNDTPKPQAEAKPKTAPAPKAAPTPIVEDEEEEDVVGGATLQDAVDRGKVLVSEGKTALIKSALADLGVKRVSELTGAKIDAFLKATAE